MKVLVTGGNGQLAQCINAIRSTYPNIDFVFTDVDELDITDSKQLNLFFKSDTFDWCINCAAYTGVDKAEQDQELADKINHLAVQNFATIVKDNGILLIHP